MDKNILYDVFRREIRDRKIPISLGKTCPVKCTFCYEKDNSYRPTVDVPLTTQEDWEYILREIQKYPTHKDEAWLLGGNEYMEWTDLFLHPRAMGCLAATGGKPVPDHTGACVEAITGRFAANDGL